MAGLPSRVFVRSPLATIVCDRKCKPTCFSKKRVCWLPKQNIWVLCSFQAWLDSGLSPRHSFPGALAVSTAGFASFSGSGWQGVCGTSSPFLQVQPSRKEPGAYKSSPETHSDWLTLGHVFAFDEPLLPGTPRDDWLSSRKTMC